jgi:BirA family biotin operon repressor/biotin-[acetyl-CoA-carboxylase] ligase
MDGLAAALTPRPVRYFERTGSTNDIGLDWLIEKAAEGSVVVANEQSSGRGRLGRRWFAPPGTALMLSYLMRPSLRLLPRCGMLGALAVCETLEAFGVAQTGVKWPNDVQVKRLKICGVLPEARWHGSRLCGVALGIGINVRVDFESTPFAATATSLETALGKPVDRVELLATLLARLDHWRSRLDDDALFQAWRSRLNMLNQPVSVLNHDKTVQGLAVDVDAEGALLVRTDDGMVQRVMAGDIALR